MTVGKFRRDLLTRICKCAELTNVTTHHLPSGRPLRPRGKLLQEDARRHHRSLLLQQLFRRGPGQPRRPGPDHRPDPGDGLRPGRRAGRRRAGRGARASRPRAGSASRRSLVGLAADSAHIVAIDLSADDAMTGAVVNLAGAGHGPARAAARRPPRATTPSRSCTGSPPSWSRRTDRPVLGIGVGSPGVVDADGTVLDAPNLGWADTPLAAGLRDALRPAGLRRQRRQHRRPRRAHLRRHRRRRPDGAPGRHRCRRRPGARGRPAARPPRGRRRDRARRRRPRRRALRLRSRRGCLETMLAVPAPAPPARRRATPTDACSTERRRAARRRAGAGRRHPQPARAGAQRSRRPARRPAARGRPTARSASARCRSAATSLVVRTSTLGEDVVLVGAAVLVLAGELGVS